MLKKTIIIFSILFAFTTSAFCANKNTNEIGIVDFTKCFMESKYGKDMQTQMENINNQWSSLIEETGKEITDIEAKRKDEDYMDGLSPEAQEELDIKYNSLREDIEKYKYQGTKALEQYRYFFVQKLQGNITKASEIIAKQKDLTLVINKEFCFYSKPSLDITPLIINEMNKEFDKESVSRKKQVSENANVEKAGNIAQENK